MFPLHCVIETVTAQQCVNCCSSDQKQILADSYAIIAGETKLHELVSTALDALGFQELATTAKGRIRLKNWKSLSFDQITNDEGASIDFLFKDLSNHITLNILAKQLPVTDNNIPDESDMYVIEAKNTLLRAAVSQVPNMFSSIDDQEVMDFAEELLLIQPTPKLHGCDPAVAVKFLKWCGHQIREESTPKSTPTATTKFNHFLEIPKLERWFADNPNPNRSRILQFMHILNSSNFRKHTQKVSFQQISNWFSNARTLQRKQCGIVPKVFSNHVRNTSLDFNSFLQLSSRSITSPIPSASPAPTSVQFSQTSAFVVGKTGGASIMNRHKYSRPSKMQTLPNGTSQMIREEFQSPKVEASSPTIHSGYDQGRDTHGDTSDVSFCNQGNFDTSEPPFSPTPINMSSTASPENPMAPTPSPGSTPGCSDSSNIKSEPCEMADEPLMSVESSSPILDSVKSGIDVKSLVCDVQCSVASSGTTLSNISSTGCLPSPNAVSLDETDMTPCDIKPCSSSTSGHRTRLMFDPLSEIPVLERWFDENPHPSWLQIDQFTETLNAMPYRQTYPPITTYNVKIWFKNRRAKNKRLTLNSGNSLLAATATDLSIHGDLFNL